jgi:surface antigen
MRAWAIGGKAIVFGSLLSIALSAESHAAKPHDSSQRTTTHAVAPKQSARAGVAPRVTLVSAHSTRKSPLLKNAKTNYARGYGGISCVPYARSASGIELKGNAANWWDAAAGVYQRGSRPEVGSVMNFRATGSMRLGHVAVVTQVVNSREVEIDHANWAGPGAGKGGIARAIPVVDVSENNDWSSVRVGLGRSGGFGSVYPTYGFIYDRPDRGVMLANTPAGARTTGFDEVAEAPYRADTDVVNRSIR